MSILYKSYDYGCEEELLECWNRNLIHDPLCQKTLRNKVILDENFDPKFLQLAYDNNKLIGFIYGVKRKVPYLTRGLEEHRAWINMIGVDEAYRRQGIGTQLLKNLESALKEEKTKEITLCAYSPNYFTPGIDERYKTGVQFFEKHQYDYKSDAVSMKRELWDFVTNDQLQQQKRQLQEEGYIFCPYEDIYMEKLHHFIEKEFGGGWVYNVLQAIKQERAHDTILLCVKGDDVVGFCMRKIDGHDGRFGPIGILPELRSKGLGGILLDYMLSEMKKREVTGVYFLWTHGASQRFFERHNFEVFRSYRLYRKEMM